MSKELSTRALKVVELITEITQFKTKEFYYLPKKLDCTEIDKKIDALEELIRDEYY